ncbi:MAG: HAD family hydrolase [Firmicutes bacterium]|nr:HAD family hydrolase [Bacillota bacterium]
MIKLVITDLDNTLYNWLAYFVPAFFGMAGKVAEILDLPLDEVITQYRQLNHQHNNVEPSYSTLALPCVLNKYPNKSQMELKEIFEPAFALFRSGRKEKLRLYSGVMKTLNAIRKQGILIVGCSDSTLEALQKRLTILKIESKFARLYVRENTFVCSIKKPPEMPVVVKEMAHAASKPNPELLLTICKDMGVAPHEAVYVGDSHLRDIGMANLAGITSVWARYGSIARKAILNQIRLVSFHSPAENKRCELVLGNASREPKYTIHRYSQVLEIIKEENKRKIPL